VDYVLGEFPAEEREKMPERLQVACDAIKAYCLSGLSFAMTNYNNK
jgi:PTH1 family peptidyl-tRNA hydrolase